MIHFEGETRGLDGLAEELLAETLEDARQAVDLGTNQLVSEAQLVLTGPRSGRSYRVSRTGAPHVASRAGEAPAALSGRLRTSMAATRAVITGNTVEARWGTNVEYAELHEYGGTIRAHTEQVESHQRRREGATVVTVRAHTRNMPTRRYPARPFMRPAEQRAEPQVIALWEEFLR